MAIPRKLVMFTIRISDGLGASNSGSSQVSLLCFEHRNFSDNQSENDLSEGDDGDDLITTFRATKKQIRDRVRSR